MNRTHSPLVGVWAAALAALATSGAGAFGEPGHRIVGQVAEIHLAGSRALKEVRGILRPQEALADAAVWPDTIKSPTYEDGDTAPFRLEHPAHETYHYANVAFQADRYDPDAPGAHFTDIVRMTRECIRVLKGQSQVFTRREALRLLSHLAGDIHQPLHVGNAFVAAQGPLEFVRPEGAAGWRSTLGGNSLRYGPNDNFNLHAYWDSHIVNVTMQKQDVPTFAARLAQEVGVPSEWNDSGDPETWPAQWATEVLAVARDAHAGVTITRYLGQNPATRTTHRWRIEQPSGYDNMARDRVRTQLAKGGYRLSATLKAIWPDGKR